MLPLSQHESDESVPQQIMSLGTTRGMTSRVVYLLVGAQLLRTVLHARHVRRAALPPDCVRV